MTFKVLITGAGSVMGQSIFKALALSNDARSIEVIFSNSLPNEAGFFLDQKYPLNISDRIIVPMATDKSYPETILKLVKEYNIDIIYPGTQHELLVLADLKTKNNLPTACLSYECIKVTIDKFHTFKFLKKYNIHSPFTQALKSNIQYEGNFPAIIKPRSSSSSRNIFLVESKKEYLEKLNELGSNVDNYIVQEFIQGKKEYTCGLYIDKFSKSNYSIILERTLSSDGASKTGKIIHSDMINKYLEDIANAFILEFGIYGHINIQLKIDYNKQSDFI